jgi:hypothetical protein
VAAKLEEYAAGKARVYVGIDSDGKPKHREVNKPRSPATVNRLRAALAAIFKFSREKYGLKNDPCKAVKKEPENNGRERVLNVVGDFNSANAAVIDLNKNADHFTRQSVMERAPLPVPQHRGGSPTPQEAQSTVTAMQHVEAELIFTRLVAAIGKASDDALVEKLAPLAVRNNHQRTAGEIVAEAERVAVCCRSRWAMCWMG